LSYTTFSYSGLAISKISGGTDRDTKLEEDWAAGKPGPIGVGSSTALWLHRPAFEVSFTVKNTGAVNGTEVRVSDLKFLTLRLRGYGLTFVRMCMWQIAQLYLHHPSSAGEPPSILKGFTDVELGPGESRKVTITLSRFDLSIWDTVSQTWVKPDGSYGITIGASSRDGRLNGTLTV
jgi:hypothetical protein